MSRKPQLEYRRITRQALADHLGQHEVLSAEVCTGLTVYRCAAANGDGETLAISLPEGEALLISSPLAVGGKLDRRRKPG